MRDILSEWRLSRVRTWIWTQVKDWTEPDCSSQNWHDRITQVLKPGWSRHDFASPSKVGMITNFVSLGSGQHGIRCCIRTRLPFDKMLQRSNMALITTLMHANRSTKCCRGADQPQPRRQRQQTCWFHMQPKLACLSSAHLHGCRPSMPILDQFIWIDCLHDVVTRKYCVCSFGSSKSLPLSRFPPPPPTN